MPRFCHRVVHWIVIMLKVQSSKSCTCRVLAFSLVESISEADIADVHVCARWICSIEVSAEVIYVLFRLQNNFLFPSLAYVTTRAFDDPVWERIGLCTPNNPSLEVSFSGINLLLTRSGLTGYFSCLDQFMSIISCFIPIWIGLLWAIILAWKISFTCFLFTSFLVMHNRRNQ